jgi:hypothetical protein
MPKAYGLAVWEANRDAMQSSDRDGKATRVPKAAPTTPCRLIRTLRRELGSKGPKACTKCQAPLVHAGTSLALPLIGLDL